MSRFFGDTIKRLKPYVPGEQPRNTQYIKLNTNESPYPPAPEVLEAVSGFDADTLRLYPDPEAAGFRKAIADCYGLRPEQVFAGGGSDEVLAFAFMAFFNRGDKVYFPDITYGFYEVYAGLFGLNAVKIPLRDDFSIDVSDYLGLDGNIFIANPNAPTGICLEPDKIEEILLKNPDRLVVIDEAYIDFSGGKSCLKLVNLYDNLLITHTFSKSRGLAGMRLGAGFGSPELIDGLTRVKYSFNPYNLDRVSLAAGIAAVRNDAYMRRMVEKIVNTRERVADALKERGFKVLESASNFVFAGNETISGERLYNELKEKGILVRYFDVERIRGFVRITIGTDDEMDIFLKRLDEII